MHSIHDFSRLESILGYLSENHLHDVRDAYKLACEAHAGQMRHDGSPYVNHVIEVAEIIGQWHGDRDAVIAALLHDVLEDAPVQKDEITRRFGRHVALLVDGVTKFNNADLDQDLPLDRKTETLRKLFDVMRRDVRVAIIKLADRLHNIYTIDTLPSPERRKRFALETLNVYHKLALHLGMRDVRQTFADFCVPYAYDGDGERARTLRDAVCAQGELLFPSIERQLREEDERNALESLEMQPRDLLKFLQRMRERMWQPTASDAFSVVVIVKSEEACYQLLKHIHTLYRPVSGQFRDYIAVPAESGYRSLHTHVTLPDGVVIDIRLRTAEMHEQAQFGVTTFLFRGAGVGPKFSWLQRSAEIDLQTRENSGEFWDALESDILRETISVSVDRQRIAVPKDSTALDAVYALYRERAGNVQQISIDGQLAALSHILKPDDDVYATMADHEMITFDWLKYVKTKLARSLIVEVLKQRDRSEKIILGIDLLQRELDFYKKGLVRDLPKAKQQHVSDHFRRRDFEDVITMIGEGVLRARDVVFYLYPEHRRFPFTRLLQRKGYSFKLCVSGTADRQRDVQVRLNQLIQEADVAITGTNIRFDSSTHTFEIYLSGTSLDRLHFADFIDILERQDWISKVQTMLSMRQRVGLTMSFLVALGVLMTYVLLLPQYYRVFAGVPSMPLFLLHVLPLIPILGANYYFLALLQHYVLSMRREQWFFGLGFVLNVFGVLLVMWKLPVLTGQVPLLMVLFLFTFAMLFLGYRFVRTLFELEPRRVQVAGTALSGASIEKARNSTRQKIIGYMLRFGAVFIWGVEPVLIRYTSIQTLSPLLRVHIWAVAGAISGFIAIFVLNLFYKKGKKLSYTTPYNRYFWVIVFANLSYNYFLHRSLLFTTATNVNLVLSYAPVFALLLAFLVWRRRISYLSSPKSIQQIFMLFGLSALGGTMLVYNDFQTTAQGALGDLFALMIAFSDVVFMMSNIHYVKYSNVLTNTVSLATHHFVWIAIVTLAMIAGGDIFFGYNITFDLTMAQWVTNIGVGVITLIGLVLTFEAFKRIDGLLAFMMLNLAPFIAFLFELLFFRHTINANVLFFVGGGLIIAASIFAEFINSRCEKVV
ncbi:MAG TPA: HD domain-containing protein [Candidatus Peribacteria bacterium]|nr:HD domain-containing protein [Candidatus Peribacteria bacterium]